MILQFSCSNHKSIKDKILFSMLVSSDSTSKNSLITYNTLKILRSAVIYGANGSGKSNFINAISYMKKLVSNSIKYQPGEKVYQQPHKLSNPDSPSEYNMQFIKNGLRYAYGFSLLNGNIETEYLYSFPNGNETKIFERSGKNIIYGNDYDPKLFITSISSLKDNRLFLSCAANFSNVKEIETAFLFFKEDITIYDPSNNWLEYSARLMQDDPIIKQKFIDILNILGVGLKDVKIKIDNLFKDNDINDAFLNKFRDFLTNRPDIEIKVVYEQFQTDLMQEESAGIKNLFKMICPIIEMLQHDRILICDEFESNLHESIVYEIVKLFYTAHKDKNAQLIFSTHDTSLLNENLFRHDQIWFTQLNSQRATELYSLAEIRNVKKGENLKKGYIMGKYGAIPAIIDTPHA